MLGYASNGRGRELGWQVEHTDCPSCAQKIIWLFANEKIYYAGGGSALGTEVVRALSWPQSSERPVPIEVPTDIAGDFNKASRVLPISAQASAALTRRCLQQVLKDYGMTKSKDLFDQIDEVITQGHLPPALADQLDAVRVIGNFAAHPLKSKNTGTILPVEAHEAEWNLDVLEAVFDHYFVKPAQAQARKAALNKKLAEAGKPPLT